MCVFVLFRFVMFIFCFVCCFLDVLFFVFAIVLKYFFVSLVDRRTRGRPFETGFFSPPKFSIALKSCPPNRKVLFQPPFSSGYIKLGGGRTFFLKMFDFLKRKKTSLKLRGRHSATKCTSMASRCVSLIIKNIHFSAGTWKERVLERYFSIFEVRGG